MEKFIDLTGLKCPLPILKSHKVLKQLPQGASLKVLSDDPKSPADFKAYCDENKVRLVSHKQKSAVNEFVLQK